MSQKSRAQPKSKQGNHADKSSGCPMRLGAESEPTTYGSSDLTYNDYLKVPELLSLQIPQSEPAHHDEMLFIIIHQAYELWFKLILHELETAMNYMKEAKVLRARHFVHRTVEVMRLLVSQIHILETMTPVEFMEFRGRLMPASGFQSIQFREVEILLGLKDPHYLQFFKNRPDLQNKLKARLNGPDLRSTYYDLLVHLGYKLPAQASDLERAEDPKAKEKIMQTLVKIYRNPEEDMPLYMLSESLVDLDEQLQLWREHHLRMVERQIGFKRGTGGSSGVGYLQGTTSKHSFPYLWEVRTYLPMPATPSRSAAGPSKSRARSKA